MNRLIDNFFPFPLLAGGHLQTVAGLYLPSRDGFDVTHRHLLDLEEGDQMVLHEDCPAEWQPGDPVALLVHGLCGSHASPYVRRLGWKMFRQGVRIFRVDLRGHGAGFLLAQTGTHCGRHDDLVCPIRAIQRLAPTSPLTVVSYSLGAALALNLAARPQAQELTNWKQLVAVCPPIDLMAVERFLQRRVNRNYDLYFTKRLWRMMVTRSRHVAGAPQVSHIPRPRRLREFDERVTAPFSGFASADDYYRKTSVRPRLSQITMPTLIIAAANDPIVPIYPLLEAEIGPQTEVVVTSSGGHMGYVGRRRGDPDRRWIDWRILEWLSSTNPNPHDAQYADAAARELTNS